MTSSPPWEPGRLRWRPMSEQSLVEQVAAIFRKHREEARERGGQSTEEHVATAQAAEESLTLIAAELDRLRVERK
jgi:hypothetical protein